TKVVIIFTAIMLFFEMLKYGKIILDRKMRCVIIYLIIVFCGLLNSIYFSDNLFVLWNYKEVISENFIAFIPQILFVIFLYNFLVKMNFNFLKESFEISKWLISIFLIIVSMYFLTIGGVKSNWWNVATRLTLQGTDPNEFSAMLIALSIFPQYMMFEGNNKTQIFIGMLSSITTFYAAFKTLSKGGFLTLIFAFVFCIIIFSRRNKFKVISIVLVLASLV